MTGIFQTEQRRLAIKKAIGDKNGKETRTRINGQIKIPEVRVIGEDGSQLGILRTAQALQIAQDTGLDLVEVAPNSDPPVCRIMDYGKYRYAQNKKMAEAKKKQAVVEIKEIKLRPKTDQHDIDFKVKNIRKFLANKNKVKITVRFRGREIVYADVQGMETMKKILDALQDVAAVVQEAKMEGRQMVMFVGPK